MTKPASLGDIPNRAKRSYDIDLDLLDAMLHYRLASGVGLTEQVNDALRRYLEAQGALKKKK